ncbi:long chronological lifespan protein 2 [Colletotrichum liriopes]|uniref:Long chronological lifespan protein 2 n=1 Tax=Colletotrichum liriopes TaxID=708192 RepID=A0AA37GUW6_9PEZI|nr:long chronological lifespan protein 2 [Colletotrichum liriopes]
MRFFASLPLVLLTLISSAQAQFGFFEQMFGGQQQQQQPQNVPSDPSQYQERYDGSYCEHYLCPDTLACVHFPTTALAPGPRTKTKGSRICVSRGGFAAGEAARKVELARKGLL